MALIKCKNCNKQISDKAKQCIHCGTSILKDSTMQNNKNDFLKKELEEEKIKLDNENELLKKELEEEKIKSSNLQEKLDNKKKEQIDNVINTSKKMTTKTLNFIRYFLAISCGIGGFVCLIEEKIFYMIGYLIIGISFIPFIYNIFRKNKSLSMALQVLVPIIAFIIGSIIFTIER